MKIVNASDKYFSLENYVSEQQNQMLHKSRIVLISVLAISLFVTFSFYEIARNLVHSIFLFCFIFIVMKQSLDKKLLALSKTELSTYVAIEYENRIELKGVIPAKILSFVLSEFRALKDENEYIVLEYKDSERYDALSVLKKHHI